MSMYIGEKTEGQKKIGSRVNPKQFGPKLN